MRRPTRKTVQTLMSDVTRKTDASRMASPRYRFASCVMTIDVETGTEAPGALAACVRSR